MRSVVSMYNCKRKPQWLKFGPHPPYSPDLAPPDYHLFCSLNNRHKDRKFENEEELYLQGLFDSPNPRSSRLAAFPILPGHWAKAIDTDGQYIYLINNF